ncbi:MAG: hypothetical protein FWD03_09670 [Defluviitaleaceae bacterium]|nr:hypothetical protein [Defluviitaleaceae bacterium]
MTVVREQALEMLQEVPDEKMIYVVNILKNLHELFQEKREMETLIPSSPAILVSARLKVWDEFQKYRGIITNDINEKDELSMARDEKYAHFN